MRTTAKSSARSTPPTGSMPWSCPLTAASSASGAASPGTAGDIPVPTLKRRLPTVSRPSMSSTWSATVKSPVPVIDTGCRSVVASRPTKAPTTTCAPRASRTDTCERSTSAGSAEVRPSLAHPGDGVSAIATPDMTASTAALVAVLRAAAMSGRYRCHGREGHAARLRRAATRWGLQLRRVRAEVEIHPDHHWDEHHRVVEQMKLHPGDHELKDAGRHLHAEQEGVGLRLDEQQQVLDVVPELDDQRHGPPELRTTREPTPQYPKTDEHHHGVPVMEPFLRDQNREQLAQHAARLRAGQAQAPDLVRLNEMLRPVREHDHEERVERDAVIPAVE